MIHRLKTWPSSWSAVQHGSKRCEVRQEHDRDFNVGDTLELERFDPQNTAFEGKMLTVRVTHIVRGNFGLPPGVCVMSIERMGGQS